MQTFFSETDQNLFKNKTQELSKMKKSCNEECLISFKTRLKKTTFVTFVPNNIFMSTFMIFLALLPRLGKYA